MKTKDSSEYGWLTITRDEYEKMRVHEYAGTGTPLHPDRPGHWAMVHEDGGTVLYTGITIEERA